MFPKKGKTFPEGNSRRCHESSYATTIAEALRAELGDTHRAIKTVMRWTGANGRTVKNWLAGASGPSGKHLILLVRHSDSVLKTLLNLAGRERTLTENRLISMREKLRETLELIDDLADNRN